MDYRFLWDEFVQVMIPTGVFVGIGFGLMYGLARYVGKVGVEGGGVLVAVFAVLGGVLGVATGASRTSTVGSMLPAFLTLITLLLGYWFGKESVSKYRPVIPYCMLVLVATAYFGLFAGASIRAKHEDFERKYQKHLLHYQYVDLEVEKARQLKAIEMGMRILK